MAEDFCPNALKTPTEIDADRFLTRYLGLTQDYKYLSHCGVYLGMTVFNDTDYVPVFNDERWEAEFITVKAGTVIIDNILLEWMFYDLQLPLATIYDYLGDQFSAPPKENKREGFGALFHPQFWRSEG